MPHESFKGKSKKEIAGMGLKTLGLAALLFATTETGLAQNTQDSLNSPASPFDKEIKLDIKNLSPEQIYENFGGEFLLDGIPPESYDSMSHKMSDKNPSFTSPFVKKIKEIEGKFGLKNPRSLNPNDYPTKKAFIQDYIKKSLQYEKAVGQELEKFKNDYFKGKYKYYTKELRRAVLFPNKFKGGYFCEDDIQINNGMFNQYYSPEEIVDYIDALKNWIRNYREDGTWRKYDYSNTPEELQEDAENLWEFLEEMENDTDDSTPQQNEKPVFPDVEQEELPRLL